MRVLNPFDGSLVCDVSDTTDAELAAILAAAQGARDAWRRTPLVERKARVAAGVAWFRAHRDDVARDVSRQMGKPLAQAQGEVDGLCLRAEHMLAIAEQALGADELPRDGGFTRRIEHEPLGVVLDIAAWNYPLLIAVNVVVPALLAGNVVILKHSARTPLCGEHFAKAFPHTAAVVLDHARTAALIGSGAIDHVAFTGSVQGGRHVLQQVASAPRFLDTGLELGGKDPAYVAPDADLEFTVANVVDGAIYNAGQSCCGIERVYVHEAVHREFLERAAAVLAAVRMGDPMEAGTTQGPMASPDAPAFLAGQVDDAVRRGARLLRGGAVAGDRGQFFQPTLLDGCPNDSRVMQEESFGPLLPVLKVGSDEEALLHMNDSAFGLTASVWTRDRARAERMAKDLRAGTVFQNRCDYLDPALPWTGWGDSGKGSTLSRYGFLGLTRRKAIHFRD
ncbi:MAG: aldehyde dehydrogenase family protein [Planctomycetota bacterium]